MTRSIVKGSAPIAVVLVMVGVAALAQNALTQLGLTEAAARALLLGEIQSGGGVGAASKLADAGRAAYRRVPEAARGPVTTGLFAWAKAYANSPAVEAAYPRLRTDAMPERTHDARTIDEEMRKQLDDMVAAQEPAKRMAASLPAADREKLLASLKSQEDMMRSPAVQNAQRASLEATRAQEKVKEDRAFQVWEQQFPADLQVLFTRRLREFLAATADVDFEARKQVIRGLGGETVGFVQPPGYDEKPWQWQHAFVVGREATTAARTAAEAWLKEIVP